MIPPHLLTDSEILRYFRNEHRFNDAYSRNSLPTVKDEVCVIYLYEYDIETHWIPVFVKNNDATKTKFW